MAPEEGWSPRDRAAIWSRTCIAPVGAYEDDLRRAAAWRPAATYVIKCELRISHIERYV